MKTNVKTVMMALVTTTMVACSNNQDVFDGGAIEKTPPPYAPFGSDFGRLTQGRIRL